MSKYPALILHQSKTHAVKRFHPWVFSGAVKRKEGNIQEGDIVEVVSEKGEYLGTGHYGTGSIAARIFSFKKIDSLAQLWNEKFKKAYEVRLAAGLAESPATNVYRLINAEGDGMPGLIADWYNGTLVFQCHTVGMDNLKSDFVEAAKEVYGEKLKAVYDKSIEIRHPAILRDRHDTERSGDEPETQNSKLKTYLYGTESEKIVLENGHQFAIDWVHGQKTGFFIDQRDNRQLLTHYVKGKTVLNTFCYSGGFSVYALKAGATMVHSVDSSAKAIEWTNENVNLNHSKSNHEAFVSDVFDFLKGTGMYDTIVLDPPAFAKGHSARHSAIKAYTRLNEAAFKQVNPGGIVFTFSCSQVVSQEMFEGAVTSAAIQSGRTIRILHRLTQPADHPISIYNPEGLYLKGLVLFIE